MAENDEDRGATTTTSPVDHKEWTGPVAAGVQIGGEYSEDNPDHIPNPTDVYRQYKTSGTGAHEDVSEVSPIFDADRQTLAVEAARALDPDDTGVPRNRVILPDDKEDNAAAVERIQRLADKAVEEPVVVGGPGKAEQKGALSGPRGEAVAIQEETDNPHRAVAANTSRARHDTSSTNYPTPDSSQSASTPSTEGESSKGTPAEAHAEAVQAAQQSSSQGAGHGSSGGGRGQKSAEAKERKEAAERKEAEEKAEAERKAAEAKPQQPGGSTS